MAFIDNDVDSIWATSSTLQAFKIPEGIHRVAKINITRTVVADFGKKSSMEASYSACYFISRSQFPVNVFLDGIGGTDFFALVIIPSLKDLGHHCVSSYHNGRWLWTDSPKHNFEKQNIKNIVIHTDDFPVLERNIARHVQEDFPHATVLYGIYLNGLRGNSTSVLKALTEFITRDHLEHIVLHKAIEVTVSAGGTVALANEFDLRGCTTYHILGSPTLTAFTCNGRRGLPNLCRDLNERVTYLQGYYPVAAHAGNVNDHCNLPITLAAVFGFQSGNHMLDDILMAAYKELAAIRAALFAFWAKACPYRIEIVTEWDLRQSAEQLDYMLSTQSLDKLASIITDGQHLDIVTKEELRELTTHVLAAFIELEEMVDMGRWPVTLDDFGRLTSLENILLCCVRGGTQYVNYRSMKCALGGRTLSDSVGPNGSLLLPDTPFTVPAAVLLAELSRSEHRRFHKCIHLFVGLLVSLDEECDREHRVHGTCNVLARTIIQGVHYACDVDGLNAAIVTAARRRVCGHVGFNEAVGALEHMDTNNAMRIMLALLTTRGAGNFCTGDEANMERALHRALSTCDVFPLWRPIGQKDSNVRFMRLCLTTPEEQFCDALDFLEHFMKVKARHMERLSVNNPGMQLCMNLAIQLSESDLSTRRTWTAWLMLLLIVVWRGPSASCDFFSWAAWNRHVGWNYVIPLLQQGVLKRAEPAPEHLLGNLKIATGYLKHLREWSRYLHSRDLATPVEPEPNANNEAVRGPERPLVTGSLQRKRRRGMIALLNEHAH